MRQAGVVHDASKHANDVGKVTVVLQSAFKNAVVKSRELSS
jgi:hypothetical protein